MDTRQQNVAHMERAVLHEHRSHVAAPLVERRLDDRTGRLAVGVGFQIEHVGFQQHLFEQFVEIEPLLGRNILTLVLAAPLFDQIVHLGQLLLDMVGIGVGLVDLVDREDHRHAGGLRVVDRLDRLRHDAVVGRHDDDRHVGDLRAAGTHGREGFVSRRIEESDLAAVEHDAVRADVLRDTARLAFDDVGLADIVQQRRLAVVDVSHDGHDRRARHEGCLVVDFVVGDRLLDVGRYELDLISELFGHDHHRLGVETLVDRNHQAQVHAGRNHLVDRNVHHRRQLADGDELGHFEDRTLLLLALHLLVQAFGHQLAFLLAVLGALRLGPLRGQACQRILHLLCYLLVAHFGTHDGFHHTGALLLVAAGRG